MLATPEIDMPNNGGRSRCHSSATGNAFFEQSNYSLPFTVITTVTDVT
ncbi:Hypothetical protein CpOVID04_0008 [Corynebacterium pseudotuberculosis]|nr:Hypothetical protein Cp226_0008 [Corynebacterium pseudotuberculosis]ALP32760.1 Hypothetical protein CpN1_0008 [Corynebacterium pseudotuberculosis]ARS59528.1 Hypothetical protein CpATCC19410_0008 [Corynebacterium pseudotuberculosis]QBG76288.1 Hypothetical protein CpCAP1R_0008 [Corynebacterium pseudotuberculosis]QBI71988.1 Hypothetical protein Cp38MAT_0008 [Corynebacterium pseudotuberculosis]